MCSSLSSASPTTTNACKRKWIGTTQLAKTLPTHSTTARWYSWKHACKYYSRPLRLCPRISSPRRSEALRLYPVVPSGSQRSTTKASGGRAIGQQYVFLPLSSVYQYRPHKPSYIPPGQQVRIHFWSVHHDPRNFTHATTYFPERWLIAEGLESMPSGEPFVHNRNAYVPFSFGPANCVGKNMALLEMRIVICHLMQCLDLRLADGWDPAEWDEHITERFTIMVGKLPVVVTPRQ